MANNEWGTPSKYIESARKVMGSIDLDPASNKLAQKVVRANVFYTKEKSSFGRCWHGNTFLNPPYGRGLAEPFVYWLTRHYISGDVPQAVVLTNAVTDVGWYVETIARHSTALCMPDHRIAFINPDTNKPEDGNDRNQIFTYLGPNVAAFVDEFSQYGLCSMPWHKNR